VTTAVLIASSLLIVVLAFALARERRLRLALQRLLAKLLSFWRSGDEDALDGADDAAGRARAGDRLP
jgi:hypothetical protein